jgi:hypothetical protein
MRLRPLTLPLAYALGAALTTAAFAGFANAAPVDPLVPAPPTAGPPRAPSPGQGHVLYLNFDGAQLTATGPGNGYVGTDSAPQNEAGIIDSTRYGTVSYPAFDATVWQQADSSLAGLTRPEIIQKCAAEVASLYAPYDITITTKRPSGGDYTMVMVGGPSSIIGEPDGVAGVGEFDCTQGAGVSGTDQNPDNIAFAFSDAIATFGVPLDMLAVTIAQESAHTYGLGHTANQMDVMYWQISDQETGFLSGAFDSSDPSVPLEQACFPGATMQDSNGLLLQILGPTRGGVLPDAGIVSVPDAGNPMGPDAQQSGIPDAGVWHPQPDARVHPGQTDSGPGGSLSGQFGNAGCSVGGGDGARSGLPLGLLLILGVALVGLRHRSRRA